MSNNIKLKQGLNLPIMGEAALRTSKNVAGTVIAIKPTDFKGLIPRLLVKEGDAVKAGSPVLADKVSPQILFTSPVSGTVAEVVRGEKRKLLEVRINVSETQEYVDFGKKDVEALTAEQVKEALLESGLWPSFIQRPYGTLANPAVAPKAIFVSGFTTAPLAADVDYALAGELSNIQAGVNAVAKLAPVHLSVLLGSNSPLANIQNVTLHTFTGKHPAGNVGIQIHHISPIQKGEIVWAITPMMLAAIGKLFTAGKYDVRRKVAITGPCAMNPSYVSAVPGLSMKDITEYYDTAWKEIRFISGDVLTGENIGENGFLGFYDNQVSFIEEGNHYELFGWCKPFRTNLFSASRAYFSWLTPNKEYEMDTNTHGGERAFLMSDVYGKVLPMKIFPVQLIKACMAGNIDKMEELGIYEVLPEDIALCEYVCPSKVEWIAALNDGINLMIKEMA